MQTHKQWSVPSVKRAMQYIYTVYSIEFGLFEGRDIEITLRKFSGGTAHLRTLEGTLTVTLKIYRVFDVLLHLHSAYYQVNVLKLIANTWHLKPTVKLHGFNRIPSGVTNGVAALQGNMSQFIEQINLRNTFLYLEKVTVAGRNQEEHDDKVKSFLDAIHRPKCIVKENPDPRIRRWRCDECDIGKSLHLVPL